MEIRGKSKGDGGKVLTATCKQGVTAYSCMPFFSAFLPLNLLLNSSSTDVCMAAE